MNTLRRLEQQREHDKIHDDALAHECVRYRIVLSAIANDHLGFVAALMNQATARAQSRRGPVLQVHDTGYD